MKSRIWKNGLYAACLAAGVTLGGGAPALAAELPAGLQVGGQDLGGLDREEADQKIEEYVNGLQDQQISIHVGDQVLETSAKELGLAWSNREAVDETMDSLTEGNLLRRYMAATDLAQEGGGLKVETAVDGETVAVYLAAQCADLDGGAEERHHHQGGRGVCHHPVGEGTDPGQRGDGPGGERGPGGESGGSRSRWRLR